MFIVHKSNDPDNANVEVFFAIEVGAVDETNVSKSAKLLKTIAEVTEYAQKTPVVYQYLSPDEYYEIVETDEYKEDLEHLLKIGLPDNLAMRILSVISQ